MTASTTLIGTCPECEGAVSLKPDTMEGEIVVCGDCGVDLEVRAIAPSVVSPPASCSNWPRKKPRTGANNVSQVVE